MTTIQHFIITGNTAITATEKKYTQYTVTKNVTQRRLGTLVSFTPHARCDILMHFIIMNTIMPIMYLADSFAINCTQYNVIKIHRQDAVKNIQQLSWCGALEYIMSIAFVGCMYALIVCITGDNKRISQHIIVRHSQNWWLEICR